MQPAAAQSGSDEHVVPSGTSVPTQLPAPSHAPFCLQSFAREQLLPFADGDCVQLTRRAGPNDYTFTGK